VGHETDRTIADEVAHASWKTPTACAAGIVELAQAGARRVEDTWEAVVGAAADRLERGVVRVDRAATRVVRSALADLDHATSRVERHRHAVGRQAEGHLIRQDARLQTARRTIAAAGPRVLADEQRRLDSLAATVRAYDPAASLARGWSITRTADGRVARAADLVEGTSLMTTLADGVVESVTVTVR
jgi:exodeoxyribonuclease VII large subunit